MFDTVLGLPVHVLVIHAIVVLVPLAAAGAIAIAVVPPWRQRFGVLVILAATAGVVLTPVATRSGRRLKERVGAEGVVARQIEEHQEIGDLVIWPVLALWVLCLALVLLPRRRRNGQPNRAVTAVSVLTVLAAVAAGAVVVRAGHLGTTAVWSCTIGSDLCR